MRRRPAVARRVDRDDLEAVGEALGDRRPRPSGLGEAVDEDEPRPAAGGRRVRSRSGGTSLGEAA